VAERITLMEQRRRDKAARRVRLRRIAWLRVGLHRMAAGGLVVLLADGRWVLAPKPGAAADRGEA